MEFNATQLPGVFIVSLFHFRDDRGSFVKTFHADAFRDQGLSVDFKESFYSSSKLGVIRGMHFQLPPHDHDKLVYPVQGRILDVLLDVRKNSGTYGQFITIELDADNPVAVYIPKGIAHGFTTLSEDGTLVYMTTTMHHKASDTGIRYDSIGFNWPVEEPVISDRDRAFVALDNFVSPF